MIAGWPSPPSLVVPTHGDWQPRNWLLDGRRVLAIDFGRAGLRPAMTDLIRLDAQQFQLNPDLVRAFFRGYGEDPRKGDAWRRSYLREGISVATWAFQVGDKAFETQGHQMIAKIAQ